MQFLYIVFAWLTRLIFTLVSQVLLLIDNLSKYNFFSVKTVNEFTTKVYVIVGVLMLFKLVISAIQYIINPDNFSDKNKGLGSILTKSVIVVVLLAVVPTLFDFALDVQNTIVDAIPNVIFGNDTTSTNNNFDNVGEQISVSILSGFLSPKSGKTPTVPFNTVDDFEAVATDGCNASIISNEFLYGTRCVYDFWWVLAFPVGIFLVVVLIAMAADVGIRTIKFGIVQILAPIPIVSYITDEKKFNNWVTTSLQIYADLFIRMAVIYFVIYFIKIILQDFLTTTGYPQEFASAINRTPQPMEIVFVKVFIVIALIMFAKNAPKFITDLLGIKGVDDSITNMFKRAGGIFRGATSGVRDTIAGGINRYNKVKSDPKYKDHKGKQIATALRSAAMTGRNSVWASTKAVIGGKGYKEVGNISQTAAKRAYDLREARRDAGNVRWGQYQWAVAKNRMGIQSNLDASNAEIEAAKAASDKSKAALDYVHNNIAVKFGGVKFTDAMMADTKFLDKIRVEAGKDVYSFTGGMTIDIRQMGKSGTRTIAGVLSDLNTIVANKNGTYNGEDIATASRLLDKLQGEADKYIIGSTKAIEANPSSYASVYQGLGFDPETNPAFGRMIEEALEANVMHSADTQFGRDVLEEARKKNIVDINGNVKPDKVGEWLNLNKKMGQNAQTSNIQAKSQEGAAAAAKQIADKYDNKK